MPAEAVALVAELRARGVELRAVGDRLRYKPASALSPAEVEVLRLHKAAVIALLSVQPATPPDRRTDLDTLLGLPETPVKDLTLEYRLVLSRLYVLGAMGPDADPAECHRLLQEQQRLHDDLGPEFARAVDRQYSRVWAARTQRCPSCGAECVFHDPDTGETIPIDIDTIVKWTAGTSGVPAPEVARGWPDVLEGLGPRRPGPFARCWTCNTGTFAFYGGRPLCRACAIREQT